MPQIHHSQKPRRTFLQAAAAAVTVGSVAPAIHGADDKSGSRLPIIGNGAYRYEVEHNWGRLPEHIRWGDTHGVCFDCDGLAYITHQSTAPTPMDAVVVLDPQGNFIRSFGKEFHGGGHGLEIRREGNEEFLYLCDIKNRRVAKLSLRGEVVWSRDCPKESGVYGPGQKYCPTNVAFAPDGGFYVGDGYGSHYIHQYDKDAKWVRTWGGAGSEPGQLRTPHGLCFDDRPGRTPALVVADRANSRLQYFTPAGKHLGFVPGLPHPCHFSIRGSDLLVPDLHSRLTILDGGNQFVAQLGFDPAWTARVQKERLRGKPDQWQPGRFVHPHQARFDREGNIFVVEWVPIGRVSKLRHVA